MQNLCPSRIYRIMLLTGLKSPRAIFRAAMINIEFQKYIFDSKINSSGAQNNEVLVFHRRLSKLF